MARHLHSHGFCHFDARIATGGVEISIPSLQKEPARTIGFPE